MIKPMLSILAFALLSSTAFAKAPEAIVALDCKLNLSGPTPLGGPKVQVIKAMVKGEAKYSVKIRPQNPTVPAEVLELVSAGSGDEDYDEYKTLGANNHKITGASINHDFEWASVLVDGSSLYNCRAAD